MPEKNGIEALKQIREHDANMNIIIVSAVGQKQMIIEALKIGAKDFIVKPFKVDEVVKVIKKNLS